MLVKKFYYIYKFLYTLTIYSQSIKKTESPKTYSVQPIPSNPIKLALRARRVNPALDPGGNGKEFVGNGSGTERARLARG